MELGQFSVSLSVKDINASLEFYTKLGFSVYDGNKSEGWLILKNGPVVVGIFQGMFEGNLMTFNPTDVRGIQKTLKESGVALIEEADPTTDGPAFITLTDPDGNNIMFDQHDPNYNPDPKL